MSKTDSTKPKPRKNSSFKSSSSAPAGRKPQRGSSSGPVRGRTGGPRREVPKYNPSMFIKNVEERTVTTGYVPKNTFSDFALEQHIKDNIAAKGYTAPTPIQDEVIPYLLEGKDVIATANTGTGKTAAFLIPLINNILINKTKKALIITPTRELADQIQTEFRLFAARTGISSALCIGGLSINTQMQQLSRNPAVVIGTPGRLMDLEDQRALNFNSFDAIVLDEVDTMLDMGFIQNIKYIISKLPKKRHSLFFSATIASNLKGIMDSFLTNPVHVSVKTRQSAENVNQSVLKIDKNNKLELLHDLLIKPEFTRVIIFSRTKRATDKLSKALTERGFQVAAIHGDKTQAARKKALQALKNDKVKILLATDVVARGIDIDDVSHVINYDLPQTYEDYIHRIGRTGRAQKIGQAITFID